MALNSLPSAGRMEDGGWKLDENGTWKNMNTHDHSKDKGLSTKP